MKFSRLVLIFAFLFVASSLSAQGISGEFKLTGVHVQYYDVARDSGDAAEDEGSTHTLNLSWPTADDPQFEFPVEHFESGDTIAAPETPELLWVPEGLAYVGIDLTLIFSEDGSFEIPTSTYPTTRTEDCSTFAAIPTIQDQGTYEWDGNEDRGQFGIGESNIFDLFDADAEAVNHGWITVFPDFEGRMGSLAIEWEAIDGTDSNIGIDDEGNLNRQMGISTLPADDDFVAYLRDNVNPDLNVGTFPTAGENYAGDGEELSANWMYLFDPVGPDGDLFTDDEPLQFTGYYFTYNFLVAVKTLKDAFAGYMAQNPTDIPGGVAFAVEAVLNIFGAPSTVVTAVSEQAYDQVETLINLGLTLEEAVQGGMIWSIGASMVAAAGSWTFPDDSDHDVDLANLLEGGRLVFEMGNQCVPDLQTRIVTTILANVLTVEKEEDLLPTKFALRQNYPNPFNPSTTIAFDLPQGSDVTVTVLNLLGETVRTLHSGYMERGRYTVVFDGRDRLGTPLPTGMYLYRFTAQDYTATKKMLLMK
ncbi:MAG: FlgD immunoglobulin-like domain containing protein [Candidatus Neomarinimicrobiota bacterium]